MSDTGNVTVAVKAEPPIGVIVMLIPVASLEPAKLSRESKASPFEKLKPVIVPVLPAPAEPSEVNS